MLALATLSVTLEAPDTRLAVAVLIQPLAGLVAVSVKIPLPEATGLVIVELLRAPPEGLVQVKLAAAGFRTADNCTVGDAQLMMVLAGVRFIAGGVRFC